MPLWSRSLSLSSKKNSFADGKLETVKNVGASIETVLKSDETKLELFSHMNSRYV